MNHESERDARDTGSQAATDVVHAALRFLRVLRYRQSYMIASVAICGLLGALYYFTATRIYQATASLLVLNTGTNVLNPTMTAEDQRSSLLPTYEKLFTSPVVLAGAVERLHQLPAEARIEFGSQTGDLTPVELRENLQAKSIRKTNLIEIKYRSEQPRASEAVVEAVVEAYLHFMDESHKSASAEILRILNEEREQVWTRLSDKQRELLKLQRGVGVYTSKEGTAVLHPTVQRVVHINETYLDVLKQRVQLQAALATVQDAVRRGGDLRQHLSAFDATVGQGFVLSTLGLNPEYMQTLSQMERQIVDNRARLETLLKAFDEAHPRVIELRRNIQNSEQFLANYQAKISQRLDRVHDRQLGPMLVSMFQERLAKAWSHEKELYRQYKMTEAQAIEMNDRMAEVAIVEHDLRLLRNMHDALADRIASIDIQDEQGGVRVQVVGDAIALDIPVSPQLSLVALICLLGGLGIGASVVYVVDLLDDRFRSPEELSNQLGLPVLAMVQKLTIDQNTGVDSLQVHVANESVESEAFRTLRTTLAFSGRELGRVAITSSEPGDGKTTVLANLAVTYAQAGKKTLLIDADLRRPGLTRLMGQRGHAGVSDVVHGEGDIAQHCTQLISTTQVEGLDLLPCGTKTPDPCESLSSLRFAEIIEWAESAYDQVLVDCPPVMAASDAALIGRLVDGMILVVQPEKNHRRLVIRAVDSLTSLQVELVGVVANRISSSKEGGYYDYGYGYGYGCEYGGEGDGQTILPLHVKRPAGLYSQDSVVPDSPASQSDNQQMRPRHVA